MGNKRKIDQAKTVQFFAHHLHIPSKLEILAVVLGSVLSHRLMRMQTFSPGPERNKTRTVKVVFLLPPCKIFGNSVESWLNGLQHVVSVLSKS